MDRYAYVVSPHRSRLQRDWDRHGKHMRNRKFEKNDFLLREQLLELTDTPSTRATA